MSWQACISLEVAEFTKVEHKLSDSKREELEITDFKVSGN
jgi:hypothetical protein